MYKRRYNILYTLENEILGYGLDEKSLVRSVFNKRTGHEYRKAPGRTVTVTRKKDAACFIEL